MGMFDSVIIPCAVCGAPLEFQSKAGDCSLRSFTLDNVPSEIAADLNGQWERCKCGAQTTIASHVWISSSCASPTGESSGQDAGAEPR